MATEKRSIAETWQARIDQPKKKGGWDASINKQAVKRMMDAAVGLLQETTGRCTDIYIFEDGSSLYEKRRDDWYTEDDFVQCPECDEWRKEDVEECECAECLTG
jgi:hypothetical protein